MKAIAIATVNEKCLPVLLASIDSYVPPDVTVYLAGSKLKLAKHKTVNLPNEASNFGDAYNFVVQKALNDYDDVVVCNDDIVLNPYTWDLLTEDISILSAQTDKVGWIAARSDYARDLQNIRQGHGEIIWCKYPIEDSIIETKIIAPILGWISKKAWVDFPPINWYSDDIQCLDMGAKGFHHFISRAYVHHVGGVTCGRDGDKCLNEARPWIEKNRPELVQQLFGLQ